MKNKYDTSVVFLYATGREDLLPAEFRKQIPYSTISDWRRMDHSRYLGHEFRYFFDDAFDKAELNYRYNKLKKAMMGLARSWVRLAPALVPIVKHSGKDRKQQKNILEAIHSMKEHIGLELSLKLLGLSRTLYQQWLLEARFDCFDSFTALCVKRHPHQLQMKEVEGIKRMLCDPEHDHWPIVSIAGLGLRKGSLVASLYTWYKYAKLFGLSKKLVKKDRKTIGLVSQVPNEYLHVDTTYYPLNSGQNVCITFVMDNYSKMILGYQVAEHLSFEVVKQAVAMALQAIMQHPDQKHSFLVTDGGTENNNKQIDRFLSELSGHKLTKIRALKDIRFSNSPVEAIHRTIKGRYLRYRKFESVEALKAYLDWAVMDYNTLRPHYKHRPRTPQEVYFNTPLKFDIKKRVKKAIQKRVAMNKCTSCTECSENCKNDKKAGDS